jgi:hypothetical protein
MVELCCRERRFDVVSRRVRRVVTIVVDVAIAMTAEGVIVVDAGIVDGIAIGSHGGSFAQVRRGLIRQRLCCRA